jgi:hypothetical protein
VKRGDYMGDLEFFRLDKDGAGWESIDKAPKEVVDKVVKGLSSPEDVVMLCFICHKKTNNGNVCIEHRNVKGAVYRD